MSWDMVTGRKRLVKFYSGCPTAEIFMFIVDHVRPKQKKLQYYRGSSSTTTTPKKYQISPVTQLCQRKPGKPRVLSLEYEILMTCNVSMYSKTSNYHWLCARYIEILSC